MGTGDIHQYDGELGTSRKIGGPGYQFVANQVGLYGITPNKQAVARYDGTGANWTPIGGPADALIVGGTILYGIEPGEGNIHQYDGTPLPWQLIGAAGRFFAANQRTVYNIGLNDHQVYQYNGTPGNWISIGGDGGTLIAGGTAVDATEQHTGNILRYPGTPGPWEPIGGPGYQFAANNTTLYGISPDRQGVYQFLGTPYNWQQIGGPASALVANDVGVYIIDPQDQGVYVLRARGTAPWLRSAKAAGQTPTSGSRARGTACRNPIRRSPDVRATPPAWERVIAERPALPKCAVGRWKAARLPPAGCAARAPGRRRPRRREQATGEESGCPIRVLQKRPGARPFCNPPYSIWGARRHNGPVGAAPPTPRGPIRQAPTGCRGAAGAHGTGQGLYSSPRPLLARQDIE